MAEYLWHKSNYKLMKGKWGIAILLEAGYRVVSDIIDENQYIQLTDRIYFQTLLLPYPDSQSLSDTERDCFCDGLKMVSKYIYSFIDIPKDAFLMIALRFIQFDDCNIQNEAFTASAIQWASEMFCFPIPNIKVYFDPAGSVEGMDNGGYVFDFLDV